MLKEKTDETPLMSGSYERSARYTTKEDSKRGNAGVCDVIYILTQQGIYFFEKKPHVNFGINF
jgi:hypothetical protein